MAVLDCIRINQSHKLRIYNYVYIKSTTVGIGTLPTPLSPASVPLSPVPGGGGGAQSPAGEGLGKSQFRRLEKSLALCLLCDQNPYRLHVILSESCKKDFNA